MSNGSKKKTKETVLKGTQPGIRPRHIVGMKNLGKSRTEAEAFEKAGYKPSYAKSGEIKKTKSWKAVSEIMLPNDLLADRNVWLLNFKKLGFKGWQPVNAGLDKAYKAKRIYTDGTEINVDPRSREEIIQSILRRITGDRPGKRGVGEKG